MKQLNVAVIGLGASYWLHCMPIKELPDLYDFKYVCDIDPQKIEKFTKDFPARGVSDYKTILDDESVDLVVIATPCKLHKKLTMDALSAAKHVLVEKPIAPTITDADEMIAAAKSSQKVLTVYHEARLYPDKLLVNEIIKRGTLGKIMSLRTATPIMFHEFQNTRRWPKEDCGTASADIFVISHLYDCMVHSSDAVLTIVDRPVKNIYCRTGSYPGISFPTDWEILIDFDSGPQASLASRFAFFDTGPFHKWEVYGTAGTLMMEYTNEMGSTLVKYRKEHGDVAEETYEARDVSDGKPFRGYYRKLHDSIVHGKELFVTPEQARDAIKVLHLALESSRIARPVLWSKTVHE